MAFLAIMTWVLFLPKAKYNSLKVYFRPLNFSQVLDLLECFNTLVCLFKQNDCNFIQKEVLVQKFVPHEKSREKRDSHFNPIWLEYSWERKDSWRNTTFKAKLLELLFKLQISCQSPLVIIFTSKWWIWCFFSPWWIFVIRLWTFW